jgi:molybdate transport system ATP-binding protein
MSIRARFVVDRGDFRLDVDLEVPSRGVTSLFGPSGCGKTTLLRAIAGLDRHPDGYLRFGDETWQDGAFFLPPHRRPLGYVFQEASLFDHLDVRGNIRFGARRIPAAERRVAPQHAIDLLDLGRLLDRKPEALSGGERQRVAIARALAASPRLLLMDEPLAAVDQTRKQEILPYIESLHRELDIPVIHVSHLPDEVARFADRLVLMREGRVLAAGDVHDMLTRLDLPLAHESRAAAVIDAVVSGSDPRYHLARVAFDGGELLLSRPDLPAGTPVRLRIEARDVSLTLDRQTGTSILNILETQVAEIHAEDETRVVVRLLAGPTPLLAGITRKSADELGLEPGRTVFAQVKSVALLG